MIQLHPIPHVSFRCPECQVTVNVRGWYIPGMRTLAELKCIRCGRKFFGDLPVGHGLHYPMLIDSDSGTIFGEIETDWFGLWLRESYGQRTNTPLPFTFETFREVKTPLLLNCLDTMYGHSLLKLLNAQYHLDHDVSFDLITLVPRFLRWMVPQGVAEIWTIDLPLNRGIEWNDWVAQKINKRLAPFRECWLSLAIPHPPLQDFSISRFTGVTPFPLNQWASRLNKPTVTFVWRDDRPWWDLESYSSTQGLPRRVMRRLSRTPLAKVQLQDQREKVIALACSLRKVFAAVDFAVAGIGEPGDMPEDILDLRTRVPTDEVEKKWVERYAESHIAVGVHGSNMLLPSAHAAAVLEFVPSTRWGNVVQDIIPNGTDPRSDLLRYRFLPLETSAEKAGEILVSLLIHFPEAHLFFERPWNDHHAIRNDYRIIGNERRRYGKPS
jgi:hypothetical protein